MLDYLQGRSYLSTAFRRT